jgi:hypothetical protein
MFQLDDKFLQDLGLDQLPEEQRQAFLQHIYEELELRVGTKLSEGLSDQQLDEFEGIIDRKEEAVDRWLSAHTPNYQADEVFVRLQQSTGLGPDDARLKAEFAATKWLEVNRPDYRSVVAVVLDELKQEIIKNRDAILG